MNFGRFAGPFLVAVSAAVVSVVGGCESPKPVAPAPEPLTPVLTDKGEPQGIEHYHKWSDRFGQGGQPVGEVAFRNLAALGYRTIVSVDGARPDLENAAKYGLRYVHVPIEYSGITRDEALRMVQAAKTSDGPVFFHCHHGVHRGPAAAMVVRMAVDGIPVEQATADLKASGCAPKYEGLYRDVAAFVPPTAAELATIPTDLPAFASAGDMVDHMAAASRVFENLQASEKAAWGPPPSSPDVNPPHEATILAEHFREMQRLEECRDYGDQYMKWLAESETQSEKLAESLRAGRKDDATAALKAVKKACDTCHAKHRDK